MRKRRPFAFFAFLGASSALSPAEARQPREHVVLLHGLGRGRLAMKRIEHTLRAAGYVVHNVGYASRRHDITTLAKTTLAPFFAPPAPTGASTATTLAASATHARAGPVASHSAPARVHLVTHSLGGILVRQYLHAHGVPANFGRVVMLAPPNQGCEIVDHLRRWPFYCWFNGPTGIQLGTDVASVPNTLGPLPAGAEVGVLAGDFSWNPLYSSLVAGPDDGKVSVSRTHVAGERAHRVVPTSHTWIMWRRSTIDHILTFLRTGNFAP